MIKFTYSLPKHRLHFQFRIAKRRTFDEPIIPRPRHLRKYRVGGSVERFFRYIFEHKNIKKFLGANLTLIVILSSFIQTPQPTEVSAANEVTTLSSEVNLVTEKGVQYPVKNVKITQGYRLFHPGLDFDGLTGDPIYPIKPGKVEAISRSRYAYGNAIIVNHGNQITSLYAHLSKIEVKEGQDVDLGTEIGKMGATGRASGDHLHLEIRDHGRPVNPYTVLPK